MLKYDNLQPAQATTDPMCPPAYDPFIDDRVARDVDGDTYNRLWPGELPADAKPYPDGKSWYPTQNSHNPFALTSPDGGRTWF